MQLKLVELRDKATFIPCFAIRLEDERNSEHEEYLIRRSGYGPDNPMILFGRLDGNKVHYDPYDWADRTFLTAHNWLMQHWDNFTSGSVIDVEYVLGEKPAPKLSELHLGEAKVTESAHSDE